MEDKKRAKMIAQYDRELFNTDRQVGRVLDYIKDSSYFNNSIIIFFADHGESLGENNYTGHGETLNEATLHIPFIIYIPDTIAGRRDQLLCNVDFLPTLLSLIKTKIPDYVEGKNFAPVISNPSAAEIHDSIFIQNDAIRLNRPYEECLRTKTHKIIKIGERSLQGKNSLPLPDRSKNKFYIYTPLKEEPNLKNFNSPYGIPPENQKRSLDTLSQLFDKNITRLYDFNPVLNESNYSRDQIEELQSLGYLQ
jgi:hypothetical protein